MKIIERYVFGSFLSSFLLAFVVLSFVLTISLLVQIVGFIMDGLPMSLVGEFCMVSLPETLQWSMPLSLLVSSVLVFSRLSADSEISAMRACGINILAIMRWPILFAIICTFLGFWINNEIVPRGHEVRRTLKSKVSVKAGLSVLEPGRIVDDFPKLKLYFSRKEGNWLYDLVVLDYSNPKIERVITADKALVIQRESDIDLELYHITIDPMDEQHASMARANRLVYTVKDAIKSSTYNKKIKDFRFFELLERIDDESNKVKLLRKESKGNDAKLVMANRELSEHKVELNKRLVFAMASICFVLVGIPLGIKSQRKESTIGMAVSLAISLGYYVFVILMLSAEKAYRIHPEVLIWLPVAICFFIAAMLTKKHM